MPVLPDVGSMRVAPGVKTPARSASSTSESATRSLTEPPGLTPSNFITIRTFGFGLSCETSTIGVLPMRSSAFLAIAIALPVVCSGGRATGDRGKDSDDVAFADLGAEFVQIAYVVVIDVDVHETVQ